MDIQPSISMSAAPVNPEDVTLLASCPNCHNVKPLEACVDCYKAMCAECMKAHVDMWKVSAAKFCSNIDVKIGKYLVKIDALNPLIDRNSSKVKQIKLDIEDTFSQLVDKLKAEKEDIFMQLDEIERENKQFQDFERAITNLKKDLDEFNKIIKNDDRNYASGFQKFQDCKILVDMIGKDFTGIRNKSFKVIGDYEKPVLTEKSFFGSLIINDTELLKAQNKQLEHQASVTSIDKPKAPKIHMFGTLRVQLKKVTEQMSEFQQLFKNPLCEIEMPTYPNFIASYKNNVFVGDEVGNLTVAEANDELTIKFTNKLSFNNLSGLAANQSYLAALYCDLTKENIKAISKKLKYKKIEHKNGIALFRWDNNTFKFEKVIDLYKNTEVPLGLLAPNGLVLGETSVYVSDKELKAVLKIDIKSGDLLQKLSLVDSEPIGMAISSQYLVVIDSKNNEIKTYDIDKLKSQKVTKISEEFQSFGGCFDMAVYKNNFLFVKNRSDSRVMIFDLNLNFKNVFEYEGSNFQGMSLLRTGLKQNELLVIGRNVDNRNFKLGYFNDFQ